MKRWNQLVLIAVAALTLAAGTASANSSTPGVDRREAMQRWRIAHGMRSGELRRGETRRLVRGERRIHRMEFRAKRDGVVTGRERMRMHRALDRESARIWRLKHNRRHRI